MSGRWMSRTAATGVAVRQWASASEPQWQAVASNPALRITLASAWATPKLSSTTSTAPPAAPLPPPSLGAGAAVGRPGAGFPFGLADTHTPLGRRWRLALSRYRRSCQTCGNGEYSAAFSPGTTGQFAAAAVAQILR